VTPLWTLIVSKMNQLLVQFHELREGESHARLLALLASKNANEYVSLKEIYVDVSVEIMRSRSLEVIESYFRGLVDIYNLIFAIFVVVLLIVEVLVLLYLVPSISTSIVKMYHVVLLVPFSSRTSEDLNKLMMIRL